MNRRDTVLALFAVGAAPFAARAQRPAIPVIGFLSGESPELVANRARAFRQGLGETGFVEGRNVAIEYRWAEGRYDRLPALATELVHRQVTVIAAMSTPAAKAAKAATTTIPIVFFTGTDPVEAGFVASMSRPGGNLTGATTLNLEVAPKWLELLHAVVPAATTVALLVNPANPPLAKTLTRDLEAATRKLGLRLHVLQASAESDFDPVFAKLVQLRAGALMIGTDLFFVSQSKRLAALTLRHRIPATFISREFVEAGGLMSYAGSIADTYRQVGVYTGRVLKGDKPANLPVQQSTKIELFINRKTAKALGLIIPQELILRADEVIE